MMVDIDNTVVDMLIIASKQHPFFLSPGRKHSDRFKCFSINASSPTHR
jgi:hypothetical protein